MSLLERGDDDATDLAIVDETTLATTGPEFETLCKRKSHTIPDSDEAARIMQRHERRPYASRSGMAASPK